MFGLGNPDINLCLPRASILGGPNVYVSSSATHVSSDQNPSDLKYTGDYTTPFIWGLFHKPMNFGIPINLAQDSRMECQPFGFSKISNSSEIPPE